MVVTFVNIAVELRMNDAPQLALGSVRYVELMISMKIEIYLALLSKRNIYK